MTLRIFASRRGLPRSLLSTTVPAHPASCGINIFSRFVRSGGRAVATSVPLTNSTSRSTPNLRSSKSSSPSRVSPLVILLHSSGFGGAYLSCSVGDSEGTLVGLDDLARDGDGVITIVILSPLPSTTTSDSVSLGPFMAKKALIPPATRSTTMARTIARRRYWFCTSLIISSLCSSSSRSPFSLVAAWPEFSVCVSLTSTTSASMRLSPSVFGSDTGFDSASPLANQSSCALWEFCFLPRSYRAALRMALSLWEDSFFERGVLRLLLSSLVETAPGASARWRRLSLRSLLSCLDDPECSPGPRRCLFSLRSKSSSSEDETAPAVAARWRRRSLRSERSSLSVRSNSSSSDEETTPGVVPRWRRFSFPSAPLASRPCRDVDLLEREE
mmetsp:Transcript_43570/g.105140  ORF Transcript_43570/g.105140 Transcript_43570/m.105140 type:complete len:386 (+) Transcript_43570:1425-2582(+)